MYKLGDGIKNNSVFSYLFLLVVAAIAGLQGWRTLFNNFAVEEAGINGFQAGIIQALREVPGFISLLVVFILIIIKEHRLSAISVLTLGIGIILTGFFPTFNGLLFTTFIMSLGFHYFEATNQSLTLQNFESFEAPVVFGFFKSIGALTNIGIGIIIWFISKYLDLSYIFILLGIPIIIISLYSLSRKVNPIENQNTGKKLFIRKKYWLYYLLSFFSGARRQIFVVFAVFMLVKKYDFSVGEVSVLFIINNIINFFLTPQIGKAINRFGEKKVLRLEYFSLIIVFLGYAIIEHRYIVAGLYILDHIFFGFAMGIPTYFQKIARKEDISSSISVAYTINHVSAIIIPVIGGTLWMINWRIPFFAGAGISCISLFLTKFIVTKSKI